MANERGEPRMSITETDNKSVAVQTPNPGFMQVHSLESAMACAELIASSAFCPKGMVGKPGDIVVALQMGQELGLKPMQSLQNIAVINGRPSLWGDAMLAVCRLSPDFRDIKEEYDEKTKTAKCTVIRGNESPFVQTFSEEDAKKAGLLGKEGPWRTYTRRMLQMRARGFCVRDAYPDLLRGIITKEEADDLPPLKKERFNENEGVVIDVTAEKPSDITDDMFTVLTEKLLESGTKSEDMCKHLKIEKLKDINQEQWEKVCKILDKKIEKKKKDEEIVKKFFGDEAEEAEVVTEEKGE